MGERQQQHHHHGYQQLLSFGQPHHQFAAAQQPQHPRARGGGMGSGGGEIVAVQGGHIVRSTGRKDRHSKVCTARGPRDRRVRLSAHTAIQFYDVQDRLGYDRPSKAVDWLIRNAKDAIDKLDVLPAWHPSTANVSASASASASANASASNPQDSAENSDDQPPAIPEAQPAFDFAAAASSGGGPSFLPPSLDSDAIADTIKSFFPMAAATAAPSSSATAAAARFQGYTPDLLSRTGSQSQELRLSLQSFQEPIFHHHHPHQHGGAGADPSPASQQQTLFSGAAAANLAFGSSAAVWAEQSQRMVPWNMADAGGGGVGGYLFNVSPAAQQAAALGQGQFFIQRGPLQSSNQPSIRGWPEPVAAPEADHPMHPGLYPSSFSPVGFASGAGFSGFRFPARIQGDEEHGSGGGGDNPPPSASSASHH